MSYDLTLRGWFFSHDLTNLQPHLDALDAGYPVDSRDRPSRHLRVLGTHRNFVLTAAACQRNTAQYLNTFLLLAHHAPHGRGHLFGTGEYPTDYDHQLTLFNRSLSIRSSKYLYQTGRDDLGSWGTPHSQSLAYAHHGFDWELGTPIDPASPILEQALQGLDTLTGWIHASGIEERLAADIQAACPSLQNGVATFSDYTGHVVFGQHHIETATAVTRIATLLQAIPNSEGVLFATNAADASNKQIFHQAIALKAGKIFLIPTNDQRTYPDLSGELKVYGDIMHGTTVKLSNASKPPETPPSSPIPPA